MGNKTIDGKVYDSNGQYLGSADIVYGTGPIGKQKNKGITTGLDSSATENPQPSGMFNSDKNRIKGADPKTPSTNPATRREKYNIGTSDVPQSTRIGGYDTVAAEMPKSYYPKQQTTTEDYLGAIKKLPGFSYYTNDFDNQLKEVERSLREQGIDTTIDAYGQYMTEAAQQMATINMQLGQLQAQENQVTNTQASNALLVYNLAKEVWSGLAQGQSIQQIAQNLGQEERVIQKIANNQTEELVQLNADYEEEQLRSYLRNREDLDIDIARNIAQYNNLQKNLDYQFDSAMETLRRNEFDAKRAAKETAGIYGMTGTEYTLNRIQKQYDQQMGDIKNTYNYQSASAQMAINNALEDYSKNLQRRAQDYAQARKGIQGYALQTIMNIENNIGLSADQMAEALTTAYKNVTAAQSNAMSTYLEALDNGNTTLSKQIAQAYGLTAPGMGTMRTERNNNPTAMTTDVAKSLGAKLGVDYIQGDSFTTKDGKTLCTAKLIGDPVETTIRMFDNAAANGIPIFYTKGGKQRRSYFGMKNDEWTALTQDQKKAVIESMLQHEGGSLSGMSYYAQNGTEGTSTAEAEYDAEVNDKYNILSTLKSELEEVDFSQNLKSALKKAGERDNVKSLDAYEILYKGGIRTMGALFAQAVDADAEYHKQAIALISGAPKAMGALDTVVTDFSRIYNKNFIDYLINAKGQGATFGNLTEGEGFKILTAANEMSAWMSQDDLLKRINNALNLMDSRRKSTLSGGTNVAPQPATDDEIYQRINSTTYSSGAGDVQGLGIYSFSQS